MWNLKLLLILAGVIIISGCNPKGEIICIEKNKFKLVNMQRGKFTGASFWKELEEREKVPHGYVSSISWGFVTDDLSNIKTAFNIGDAPNRCNETPVYSDDFRLNQEKIKDGDIIWVGLKHFDMPKSRCKIFCFVYEDDCFVRQKLKLDRVNRKWLILGDEKESSNQTMLRKTMTAADGVH